MSENAAAAGTFRIGGELAVHRLGFGAMRITGPGIWGPPQDKPEAIRTLQGLAALGVNFIDTADSYGPDVSEELIREALHPYPAGLVIATKAGLTRAGPDRWTPKGDPAYLRAQAEGSLKRLGVERIDLWQLHRIDSKVPRAAQFEAVAKLLEDGLIAHAGLSEVGVDDIREAQTYFPVATVQNLYNLGERRHEDVLNFCESQDIGFVPWYPLAAGSLAGKGGPLDKIAAAHEAVPGQIALAWLLKRSPVVLPIPGTGKLAHLQENVAGAAIQLSDAEFAELDAVSRHR